jgi:hypothetical protein
MHLGACERVSKHGAASFFETPALGAVRVNLPVMAGSSG